MLRPRPAVTVLALLGAAPAAAQLPPLTVPKGQLRAELTAAFLTADQRLRRGATEGLAQDFVRTGAGSDLLAGLEPADQLLQRATGVPTARLDLGATSASHMVTTGAAGLGLAYGVTSRLTVFATVPIVRVKVRSRLGFDGSAGTAGFNPADPVFGTAPGQAQTALFFSQFETALGQLEQNLASGVYTDPALRALAEQTLASATTLRQDLHALILAAGASPFLPLSTSQLGSILLQRVTTLQGTLSGSLSVSGFDQTPALPDAPLSEEQFLGFLTNPAGPVAASLETPSLSALGDVEVGASYALLDRLSAEGAVRGVRLTAQGLVRLNTSELGRPAHPFEVGTGDGQPDVEASLVGDVRWGRFGARTVAGYTLQRAGTVERRVAPPSQPLAWSDRLATLQRNPGDVVSVGATPFVRLAETLALMGGAVWRRKGADTYRPADPPSSAAAEAAILEQETSGSWTTAMLGLSYSVPAARGNGRPGLPVDAGLTWEGVIGSGGDLRVNRTAGVRMWLRLYTRFP